MVKKYNDCILIMAGSPATDDPEGEQVLNEVREYATGDPDVRILLLPPFSDRDINALQRVADVVLQKSLKEGFGLTVSEAMWKGKPVVGGAAGGIPTPDNPRGHRFSRPFGRGCCLPDTPVTERPRDGPGDRESGERIREKQLFDYQADERLPVGLVFSGAGPAERAAGVRAQRFGFPPLRERSTA